MKGYIHSFESLAALDGEGLRCAVFMQGCPLRCAYCHNPDTWAVLAGRETDPEALVKKISRYKPYFKDDGGVTFSGGEPLLQAAFIAETVPLLREKGINYAIDTSGATELTNDVKYVLENAELVLLDLKFWDNESYAKYTGGSMEKILKTLEFLEERGVRTRVRTVVVPGINDEEKVLESYLAKIQGLSCVESYELLGFHTMGFFKYKELGIKNPLCDVPPMDKTGLAELQKFVDKRIKSDKNPL